MPEDPNFEIELSDFSFVSRGAKAGKALRFTVTWKFEHPQYGLLGESEEGWLCFRDGRGDIKVSPPISRFGPNQSKQLKTITVAYFDLIRSMIVNHKTKSGTSYVDYLGSVVPEELRSKPAAEVDSELPQTLNA